MTNKKIEISYLIAINEKDFYIQAKELAKNADVFIGITKTPALLIPDEGKEAILEERREYNKELNKRLEEGKQTKYLFSYTTTSEKIDPASPEYEDVKLNWREIAKKENLQIRSYDGEIESGIIAWQGNKITVLMRRKPGDLDFNYKDYIDKASSFF